MVRSVTMADIRKSKPPSTPRDSHRDNVGKGNYNRWDPLTENGRRFSFSKRKLDESPTAPSQSAKVAKLDSNKLFSEMQVHEEKLKAARVALDEAKKIGDDKEIFEAGPMGLVIGKLLLVVTTLLTQSEGITSSIIDVCKAGEMADLSKDKVTHSQPNNNNQDGSGRSRSGTINQGNKKTITAEEQHLRKVKQEIAKAEKSTILFDLDLGQVPVINKDTLSKKVTCAIHAAAEEGEEVKKGNITARDAEEMLDDILSCTSLDFLGNGSKKFFNSKNGNDSRNGTFCTVPTKMTFKTKDERIRAEQTLRKVCKVRCSIPYPKKLREIINNMVQEGRKASPGNYIKVKVDTDKMMVSAIASVKQDNNKYVWQDLNLCCDIPLDILDWKDKVSETNEGENPTEAMDSQVS